MRSGIPDGAFSRRRGEKVKAPGREKSMSRASYDGKSESEGWGTVDRRGRRRIGRGAGAASKPAISRSSARAWPMVAATASIRGEEPAGAGSRRDDVPG